MRGIRPIYFLAILLIVLFPAVSLAEKAAPLQILWNELGEKRTSLQSFHQEFEITNSFRNSETTRSTKERIVVDGAKTGWRQSFNTGSGARVVLSRSAEIFEFEPGGDEYTRRTAKEDDVWAPLYRLRNVDWQHAEEVQRKACSAEIPQTCVLFRAPVVPSTVSTDPSHSVKTLQGSIAILVELNTGLLLSMVRTEVKERRGARYETTFNCGLRRMAFGGPPDESVFSLPPSGLTEVKELSEWNAARIKRDWRGWLLQR